MATAEAPAAAAAPCVGVAVEGASAKLRGGLVLPEGSEAVVEGACAVAGDGARATSGAGAGTSPGAAAGARGASVMYRVHVTGTVTDGRGACQAERLMSIRFLGFQQQRCFHATCCSWTVRTSPAGARPGAVVATGALFGAAAMAAPSGLVATSATGPSAGASAGAEAGAAAAGRRKQ